MSYGQMITGAKQAQTLGSNRVRKVRKVKLTFKQHIRNWLNSDCDEADVPQIALDESPRLDSDGMRLQVYKASGGYVVETRSYDRQKDRNFNTMHIVTDDQDLGDALGKIVMMEALKR